ncbi:DEAD/DEAH box helicase family protein, partial [Candidatus Vampirococcus lugosii]
MKLKFKEQQYQTDASNTVVNCFLGQTKGLDKSIGDRQIIDYGVAGKQTYVEDLFSNKKLEITPEQILKNVKNLQQENGLIESKTLDGMNFSIEMETGTGKTYVYTKTIFELNKQYGWSKFIIMVPSIAIREGVNKSLQITQEHFNEIYGKKIRFFIYDNNNKSNLVNIKNFSSSANIEVMIMNYQAFATNSKESRKIYQNLDTLNSRRPIDVIKRTHPILIIDEPQRFGDKAEKTLKEFNPLFTIRYSATHKKDFNKIYRLDAIDAYNQKLVKKINVKGIEVVGSTATNSFLFLDRINISTKTYPTAHIKMEMEVKKAGGIKRILKKIKEGDNLYELSGQLEQYKHFVVKEINGFTNTVNFTNGVTIGVGQAYGNIDEGHIRRIQIRETIRTHIEKERLMYSKGIKVLSLFFIDEVSKYRNYDENGNTIPGEYEKIFEEEYQDLIKETTLFDEEYKKYVEKFKVSQIHNGYFSVDKKGKLIDSKEKRGSEGSDDVSAYDLIMKDKEKLLSFGEPTRFIFSHSALREGWDNPNVFQICTLRMSQSSISKRQEIGRGLRICVNANGERMDYNNLEDNFFDYNTLTVIANESYENFARELQTEILDSISNRPIAITAETLKGRVFKNESGEKYIFDDKKSMDLIIELRQNGYLDSEYKVTSKFITDIETNNFQAPKELKGFEKDLLKFVNDVYSMDNFKAVENAKDENVFEKILKPNDNFYKKEFQELWNKINHKTTYKVHFNTSELIENSVNAINGKLEVNQINVIIGTGSQQDNIDQESLKTNTSIKRLDKQTQTT